MPVIYLDILLVLNLFIDFLLLSATARILRIPYRRLRLVLGALLGSACSCLIFLPDLPTTISLLIKFAAACLIIRTAFRWIDKWMYIKQVAVFFVASALFAGIAMAIWYFAAPTGFFVVNGIVYYDVSPLTLTALTVVSYVALTIYDRITHKKVAPGQTFTLLIDGGNGNRSLRALYDTGHHVTDAFTGSPVAMVGFDAIKPVLSSSLLQAIEEALGNSSALTETQVSTIVQTKLRMIPVRTVNGTGLLPAFRPKSMKLQSGMGNTADLTGSYVAVSQTLGHYDYEAIVGTDMVTLLEGSHKP